jgi:hypothetical protein
MTCQGSSAIGDSESTGSGLINPSCGLDTWKIGRTLERVEGLRGRRLNQMNNNNISCERYFLPQLNQSLDNHIVHMLKKPK